MGEVLSRCEVVREGVLAEIIATLLHVQAGDRDALRMANSVISTTATLRSGIARANLIPLATALEARTRPDHTELDQRARQIATTRAGH